MTDFSPYISALEPVTLLLLLLLWLLCIATATVWNAIVTSPTVAIDNRLSARAIDLRIHMHIFSTALALYCAALYVAHVHVTQSRSTNILSAIIEMF